MMKAYIVVSYHRGHYEYVIHGVYLNRWKADERLQFIKNNINKSPQNCLPRDINGCIKEIDLDKDIDNLYAHRSVVEIQITHY